MTPAPKATSAWRREAAGRYVSADGRFALQAEGAANWYLSDTATRDELGLARTVGPFATLGEARAAAEARRGQAEETSPLAARAAATPRRPRSRPASRPVPPPEPTWLERLATSDPARARLARRQMTALEQRGIVAAEAIVRADLEGGRPLIAEALLAHALSEALGEDLDETHVRALVDALNGGEADRVVGLPGWQLLERPADAALTPRRLRIAPGDVDSGRKR